MIDEDKLNALELFGENEYLHKEIERLNNIIKEVREYIENNSLYYQEYDYDYEENLVLGEPDDRVAKKELLEILDKENI